MRTVLVFSAVIAGALSSSNLGSPSGGYVQQNHLSKGGWRGAGRLVDEAEWGGGQGGNQAAWGGRGNQGTQGGQAMSQGKPWTQSGTGNWKNSGGTGNRQYGATMIDTPQTVGYEATFPGGRSRYVQYRTGRSGSVNGQQQGNQGRGGKNHGNGGDW